MKSLALLLAFFLCGGLGSLAVDVKFSNGDTKTFKDARREGDSLLCIGMDGRPMPFRWKQLADEEIQKYFQDKWESEIQPMRQAAQRAREADEAAKKAEEEKLAEKARLEKEAARREAEQKFAAANPDNPANPAEPPPASAVAMIEGGQDPKLSYLQKEIQKTFSTQSPQSQLHQIVVRKGFVEAVIVLKNRDNDKGTAIGVSNAIIKILTNAEVPPQRDRITVCVWAMVHTANSRPEAPILTPVGRATYDPLANGIFYQEVGRVFGLGGASR